MTSRVVALLVASWIGVPAACSSGGDPSPAVDASLLDHPIDEYGYSIVGDNIYPPLYQRVEAKCVTAFEGLPSECDSDDDCGAGFVCVCGFQQGRGQANECVAAECRTGADCNGGKCLLSIGECCGAGPALVCSRSASTCHHGGDCVGNGIACIYDQGLDHFECKLIDCTCDGP